MENSIKISLTIELEGSVLVKRTKPEVIKMTLKKKDVFPNKKWRGKEGYEIAKRFKYVHYGYDSKPAYQHLNISLEAYQYMISSEPAPGVDPKVWTRLGWKERLNTHLKQICESLNGKSYSYEILDS